MWVPTDIDTQPGMHGSIGSKKPEESIKMEFPNTFGQCVPEAADTTPGCAEGSLLLPLSPSLPFAYLIV